MVQIIFMNERPGPTGKFPDGKIRPDDDGELNMMIGIHEGNVLIHFGTLIHWLGLPPEDAIEFAKQITKKANEILETKGD